jgi:hypothetical protein
VHEEPAGAVPEVGDEEERKKRRYTTSPTTISARIATTTHATMSQVRRLRSRESSVAMTCLS